MSMPSSSDEVATRHGRVARLERLLDLAARLAGERPVVGAGNRLVGELVQPQGEPFREPPAVHEDQRRAVRAHELEQLGIDRGPDRAGSAIGSALHGFERGRRPVRALPVAEVGQVLHRDAHLEIELLADAGVDDGDVPVAADEAGDLLERALRRRQRDALGLVVAEGGEALEREREVRAALGRGHRMHLVDDHGANVAQHLALARGEHQEEALGRRDQHVGWTSGHAATCVGRRVAGAHGHLDIAQLLACRRGHRPDAGERRAEVAFDVVVERLQRREVQQRRARAGSALLAEQPIEAGEEGGERLPAAGRRADEDVLAARDRRPGACLGGRGIAEGVLEPASRRDAERGLGGDVRGHACTVQPGRRSSPPTGRCRRRRSSPSPPRRQRLPP